MAISDQIAQIIYDMLEENATVEIGRKELAEQFGCVPSQINYVISSRFAPERGYIVESRRGGGGYIRITKVKMDKSALVMHMLASLPQELDVPTLKAYLQNLAGAKVITPNEASLLYTSMSERAYSAIEASGRAILRAQTFKCVLLTILNNKGQGGETI